MSRDHEDVHDDLERRYEEIRDRQEKLGRICMTLLVALLGAATLLLYVMMTRY
jgi:hypothetical protein